MKRSLFALSLTLLLAACGDSGSKTYPTSTGVNKDAPAEAVDPMENKGIGEVKNVTLNDPLDEQMIEKGKAIYEMKCAACHKLSEQRVVGPGWAGITERRTPEWIINMTTNVEIMLAEDPIAQELLEECLVRMPNQGLSVGDARDVLEFMYHNDQ